MKQSTLLLAAGATFTAGLALANFDELLPATICGLVAVFILWVARRPPIKSPFD